MIPTLPRETLDVILDELHNDPKTLAACSLASSIFTASARRHLFSEIVLECSRICAFLKLLDVACCTIPSAIARVIIREKRTRHVSTGPKAYYTPTDGPRLIARLQGVRYIKFQDVSLGNIPPPFWDLLQGLEGVKELEIHQMSFETPVHFFRYICTLPALEALSISKSSIDVAALEMASLRPKVPFCIPFLDVGKLSPGLLDWFLAQDPIPPVHTFRMKLGAESPTSTLRQFSKAMGPSIQNLLITLPSDLPAYYGGPPVVDFGSFSNVRSVHLEGYLRLGQQPESRHFENVMRTIFAQISSPILKKVSLLVSLSIDETLLFFGSPDHLLLDIFSWGALPEIMKSQRENRLEEFHLVIRGLPSYHWRYAEQSLKTGPFAFFAERGIFSVEFR
ncbi:hypothetical protein FPV67DRAFT_1669685 [Lyophyllum atratum]|nr:hypothetical protein FPV67DRAFT_1669685 [Lyophyllum atratum]